MTTTPPPATAAEHTGTTLPAAGRPPVAAPAAGYVGTLIALLLLAAGVVAVRDATVFAGWLDGRPWTSTFIDWLDGLTVRWYTTPLGVLAIVIGLWWVYAALRPRRRTAVAVAAQTSVWIAPADLAHIASAAAELVPGVLDARAKAGLRKIVVTAHITSDTGDSSAGKRIKTAIATAVTDAVESFVASPPKVSVRTRTGGVE